MLSINTVNPYPIPNKDKKCNRLSLQVVFWCNAYILLPYRLKVVCGGCLLHWVFVQQGAWHLICLVGFILLCVVLLVFCCVRRVGHCGKSRKSAPSPTGLYDTTGLRGKSGDIAHFPQQSGGTALRVCTRSVKVVRRKKWSVVEEGGVGHRPRNQSNALPRTPLDSSC
jgi:hypothetical protein